MDVLFALALTVSQIKTGSDLLAACKAPDTTACDAFLRDVVDKNKGASCFADNSAEAIRHVMLDELAGYSATGPGRSLDQPAATIAKNELVQSCGDNND